MARPKGLNVSQVESALVASGGNIKLAAQRLGINPRNVRYWIKHHPHLRTITVSPMQGIILDCLQQSRQPTHSYGIAAIAGYPIPDRTAREHLAKLEAAGKVVRTSPRGGFKAA